MYRDTRHLTQWIMFCQLTHNLNEHVTNYPQRILMLSKQYWADDETKSICNLICLSKSAIIIYGYNLEGWLHARI